MALGKHFPRIRLGTGLVAWYNLKIGFYTTGKIFDYSRNGNTGTVSGALPKYPGFFFNGAANSAKDDYISAAADSSINAYGKTELTISAWINPASDSEGNNGRIIDKFTTVGYLLYVSNESAGVVNLNFYIKTTNTSPDAKANGIITLNRWSHIVATYNGDGTKHNKVYVDSVLQTLATDTQGTGTPEDDSAVDLYIGNRAGNDRTFDGHIGDVMIYNRALTAAEIKGLYRQTKRFYTKE